MFFCVTRLVADGLAMVRGTGPRRRKEGKKERKRERRWHSDEEEMFARDDGGTRSETGDEQWIALRVRLRNNAKVGTQAGMLVRSLSCTAPVSVSVLFTPRTVQQAEARYNHPLGRAVIVFHFCKILLYYQFDSVQYLYCTAHKPPFEKSQTLN